MLRGILALHLVDGYNVRVTAIAGGVHGATSRHYVGKAFDIDTLNGAPVNGANPFNQRSRTPAGRTARPRCWAPATT